VGAPLWRSTHPFHISQEKKMDKSKKYVVDLTGARTGTEEATVRRLAEVVPEDTPITYLARLAQDFHSGGGSTVVRLMDDVLQDDAQSLERIVEVVQDARGDEWEVDFWSYLARITHGVAERFADAADVQSRPLSRLIQNTDEASILSASVLSSDEVLKEALRVIGERPDGRIEQVNLRTMMASANPVFRKQSGPDEWKAPGFVKTILTNLEHRGHVRTVSGAGTVNPLFEITAEGLASIGGGSSRPQLETQPESQVGIDSTVQEWWDLLSTAGWNPWASLGDRLYATLADVVEESPGKFTSAEVARQVISRLRKLYQGHMPWSMVERFLMRVLQIEPVLLAGEEAVPARFGPHEPRITGLAPDFAERIRARLLVVLVQLGGDVGYTDAWRVSAVLFGTRAREDDAQDLIDRAVISALLMVDPMTGSLSMPPDMGLAERPTTPVS
jgi:hypothetical protein